jgi:hypothetical protein
MDDVGICYSCKNLIPYSSEIVSNACKEDYLFLENKVTCIAYDPVPYHG